MIAMTLILCARHFSKNIHINIHILMNLMFTYINPSTMEKCNEIIMSMQIDEASNLPVDYKWISIDVI